MTTVLHKARVEDAKVSPDAAARMVRGFAACDHKAALPKDVLAPIGVRFLDSKQAASARSSLAVPVRDRSGVRLVANDLSHEVTNAEGRVVIHAARYRLSKSVGLGGTNLRTVGEIVNANTSPALLGVTYTFDKDAGEALAAMEAGYEVPLKSKIGSSRKTGNIWIELGENGRSATCWRLAD